MKKSELIERARKSIRINDGIATGEIKELCLCEAKYLNLQPDQLYIFRLTGTGDCKMCEFQVVRNNLVQGVSYDRQ